MDSTLLYFLVGFTACFLGTIPFGPINLTVVKTTVDYSPTQGIEVVIAASLIEIVEALVAIFFGSVISRYLDSSIVIKFVFAFVFVALAIFVFTRKPQPTLDNQELSQKNSFFKKGLLVAVLNPQAIPFWIFALATISQYFTFQYEGVYLLGFLAGVLLGKLAALYGFVIASSYLKAHLRESGLLINRLLAGILLLIGISQGWNGVTSFLA